MNLEDIKKRYPDIELEELLPLFPRIPMSDYPELSGYSWEDCHAGQMAPGGIFLASDIAKKMNLKEGMRVLDLGPGNCASSLFLARHYKVQVTAAELWIEPSKNWERVKKAGLMHSVMPMKVDARNMYFAEEYFDAVFSIDTFAYFMTDDMYLPYLAKFVRPGGQICIGGHCYANELTPETPKEFIWGFQSYAYHSPRWWRRHFENTGLMNVLYCEEHPKGRELWLDCIRWDLEECHPRDRQDWTKDDLMQSIKMLLTDKQRFITHFILLAEKK